MLPCPPYPAPIHPGPTGIVPPQRTRFCTKQDKSLWWFHSSPSFFLMQQGRGSQRCHKQGGNGECQQCYSDSSRPLKKMKQGDNSHKPCWVRECLLPWQPLLPEGNLSSRMASGWGRTGPLHPQVPPVPGHRVYASLEAPNEPQTGLGLGLMASGALISKASQQPPVLPTSQNNLCRPGIGHHPPAWWWLVSTCLLGGDWSAPACLVVIGQNLPA